MTRIFRDRTEAGQLLAQKLAHFAGQKEAIVLALPRGGVPVGYEIARALKLPLDIFLVRKLGVPGQEELAFGAIGMGNVQVFNDQVIDQLRLDQPTIDEIIREQQAVLDARNQKYRGNRPFPDLKNRTVILVDDGIATGATMRAAIKAIRKMDCLTLVIAVPVAPPEVFHQFSQLADQIVCLETPAMMYAIGSWYEDFSQTTDEEVIQLLKNSDIFYGSRL